MNSDIFDTLPTEIILEILNKINTNEILLTCMLIDKRFYAISSNNLLWIHFSERDIKFKPELLQENDYKKYYRDFRKQYAKVFLTYPEENIPKRTKFIKRDQTMLKLHTVVKKSCEKNAVGFKTLSIDYKHVYATAESCFAKKYLKDGTKIDIYLYNYK